MHPQKDSYSLAIRRRMATSFSTPKSSKVWGVNASLRRILLHIGQGAGPSVNNRSIHDSHLQYIKIRTTFFNNKWTVQIIEKIPTSCDNMSLLTSVIWDSSIGHSYRQDIGLPLTDWNRKKKKLVICFLWIISRYNLQSILRLFQKGLWHHLQIWSLKYSELAEESRNECGWTNQLRTFWWFCLGANPQHSYEKTLLA